MFFVAKELVGIPGLPKTTKGIREALCRFSAGSELLVRKRTGSKAFEYHIDCLPDVAQQSLRARQIKELMNDSAKELPAAKPQSPVAPEPKAQTKVKSRSIVSVRRCWSRN